MRVVFLAHFFEKRKEEVEVISQMRGMFKYYYRKTAVIRNLVAVFIFSWRCSRSRPGARRWATK